MVFRGVQLGSVKRIDLRYVPEKHQFIIPVIVETAKNRVLDISGNVVVEKPTDFNDLVNRGLRARLAIQSILTGQLYVEVDLFPDKPAVFRNLGERLEEIPTIPSPVQEISEKLQHVDLEGLINDVAAIASSTRKFVGGPELNHILKNLDASLGALKSLSERLDRRIDPLSDDFSQTAKATTAAVKSAQKAVRQVGAAADRLGAAVDSTAAPMQDIKRAVEELRHTISIVNELAGAGVPALDQARRTMKELSQAARSLQDLAETLERQPNALLFGKQKSGN